MESFDGLGQITLNVSTDKLLKQNNMLIKRPTSPLHQRDPGRSIELSVTAAGIPSNIDDVSHSCEPLTVMTARKHQEHAEAASGFVGVSQRRKWLREKKRKESANLVFWASKEAGTVGVVVGAGSSKKPKNVVLLDNLRRPTKIKSIGWPPVLYILEEGQSEDVVDKSLQNRNPNPENPENSEKSKTTKSQNSGRLLLYDYDAKTTYILADDLLRPRGLHVSKTLDVFFADSGLFPMYKLEIGEIISDTENLPKNDVKNETENDILGDNESQTDSNKAETENDTQNPLKEKLAETANAAVQAAKSASTVLAVAQYIVDATASAKLACIKESAHSSIIANAAAIQANQYANDSLSIAEACAKRICREQGTSAAVHDVELLIKSPNQLSNDDDDDESLTSNHEEENDNLGKTSIETTCDENISDSGQANDETNRESTIIETIETKSRHIHASSNETYTIKTVIKTAIQAASEIGCALYPGMSEEIAKEVSAKTLSNMVVQGCFDSEHPFESLVKGHSEGSKIVARLGVPQEMIQKYADAAVIEVFATGVVRTEMTKYIATATKEGDENALLTIVGFKHSEKTVSSASSIDDGSIDLPDEESNRTVDEEARLVRALDILRNAKCVKENLRKSVFLILEPHSHVTDASTTIPKDDINPINDEDPINMDLSDTEEEPCDSTDELVQRIKAQLPETLDSIINSIFDENQGIAKKNLCKLDPDKANAYKSWGKDVLIENDDSGSVASTALNVDSDRTAQYDTWVQRRDSHMEWQATSTDAITTDMKNIKQDTENITEKISAWFESRNNPNLNTEDNIERMPPVWVSVAANAASHAASEEDKLASNIANSHDTLNSHIQQLSTSLLAFDIANSAAKSAIGYADEAENAEENMEWISLSCFDIYSILGADIINRLKKHRTAKNKLSKEEIRLRLEEKKTNDKLLYLRQILYTYDKEHGILRSLAAISEITSDGTISDSPQDTQNKENPADIAEKSKVNVDMFRTVILSVLAKVTITPANELVINEAKTLLDYLFQYFDTNSDGIIIWDEMKAMLENELSCTKESEYFKPTKHSIVNLSIPKYNIYSRKRRSRSNGEEGKFIKEDFERVVEERNFVDETNDKSSTSVNGTNDTKPLDICTLIPPVLPTNDWSDLYSSYLWSPVSVFHTKLDKLDPRLKSVSDDRIHELYKDLHHHSVITGKLLYACNAAKQPIIPFAEFCRGLAMCGQGYHVLLEKKVTEEEPPLVKLNISPREDTADDTIDNILKAASDAVKVTNVQYVLEEEMHALFHHLSGKNLANATDYTIDWNSLLRYLEDTFGEFGDYKQPIDSPTDILPSSAVIAATYDGRIPDVDQGELDHICEKRLKLLRREMHVHAVLTNRLYNACDIAVDPSISFQKFCRGLAICGFAVYPKHYYTGSHGSSIDTYLEGDDDIWSEVLELTQPSEDELHSLFTYFDDECEGYKVDWDEFIEGLEEEFGKSADPDNEEEYYREQTLLEHRKSCWSLTRAAILTAASRDAAEAQAKLLKEAKNTNNESNDTDNIKDEDIIDCCYEDGDIADISIVQYKNSPMLALAYDCSRVTPGSGRNRIECLMLRSFPVGKKSSKWSVVHPCNAVGKFMGPFDYSLPQIHQPILLPTSPKMIISGPDKDSLIYVSSFKKVSAQNDIEEGGVGWIRLNLDGRPLNSVRKRAVYAVDWHRTRNSSGLPPTLGDGTPASHAIGVKLICSSRGASMKINGITERSADTIKIGPLDASLDVKRDVANDSEKQQRRLSNQIMYRKKIGNSNNVRSNYTDSHELVARPEVELLRKHRDGDFDNQPALRVAVRCRPLLEHELARGSRSSVTCQNSNVIVEHPDYDECKRYTFDRVFEQHAHQEEIFRELIAPLVLQSLEGFKCTIIAYGQTGAGKTYTMEGPEPESQKMKGSERLRGPDAGLIARSIYTLFGVIQTLKVEDKAPNPNIPNKSDFSIDVSHLEIYNEEIADLLAPSPQSGFQPKTAEELYSNKKGKYQKGKRDNQRIHYEPKRHIEKRDDPNYSNTGTKKLLLYRDKEYGMRVSGLTRTPVRTPEDIISILETSVLRRQTAETELNKRSSRSHSVFTINIKSCDTGREGQLTFVDLSGSENLKRSKAEGIHARETQSINKSLLAIGRVAKALIQKQPHIPYRDSVLTHLLQDSLGGSAIATILLAVSPQESDVIETLNTLSYASLARNIVNQPRLGKITEMNDMNTLVKSNPLRAKSATIRKMVKKPGKFTSRARSASRMRKNWQSKVPVRNPQNFHENKFASSSNQKISILQPRPELNATAVDWLNSILLNHRKALCAKAIVCLSEIFTRYLDVGQLRLSGSEVLNLHKAFIWAKVNDPNPYGNINNMKKKSGNRKSKPNSGNSTNRSNRSKSNSGSSTNRSNRSNRSNNEIDSQKAPKENLKSLQVSDFVRDPNVVRLSREGFLRFFKNFAKTSPMWALNFLRHRGYSSSLVKKQLNYSVITKKTKKNKVKRRGAPGNKDDAKLVEKANKERKQNEMKNNAISRLIPLSKSKPRAARGFRGSSRSIREALRAAKAKYDVDTLAATRLKQEMDADFSRKETFISVAPRAAQVSIWNFLEPLFIDSTKNIPKKKGMRPSTAIPRGRYNDKKTSKKESKNLQRPMSALPKLGSRGSGAKAAKVLRKKNNQEESNDKYCRETGSNRNRPNSAHPAKSKIRGGSRPQSAVGRLKR